jgi:flagellar hook-associated protein 2
VSMSVDGLVSGMDTTSLITQLLQAESGPQTQLKSRLATSQTTASAYRTVNTTFAAVRTAAETMLKPESWTATKATSSDSSAVSVSATSTATPGALSFSVEQLATAHSVVQHNAAWTTAASAAGFASLDVYAADGVTVKGTITVGGTGTLTDAAAAINASSYDLSAAVVQLDATTFSLQVTSKKTGQANTFTLGGGGTFDVNTAGQNAKLKIGTTAPYTVSSDTNAFSSVMPGVTFTALKANPGVADTATVTADPDKVATTVQALVDAVNVALTNVKTYTNNAKGSTAALRGNYEVSQMGGQLLDAVSFAIGTDGSPAQVGFQLSKDGKVTFDKAKFVSALKADPALAQRMVGGTAAGVGADAVAGTSDDVAATGIAGRLLAVAKSASDTTTGSLVKLADGQDSMVKDIQDRIDAWDLRLAKRKETLTRQFTAMETALSSLKNQSTWLAGQINGLPSYK